MKSNPTLTPRSQLGGIVVRREAKFWGAIDRSPIEESGRVTRGRVRNAAELLDAAWSGGEGKGSGALAVLVFCGVPRSSAPSTTTRGEPVVLFSETWNAIERAAPAVLGRAAGPVDLGADGPAALVFV